MARRRTCCDLAFVVFNCQSNFFGTFLMHGTDLRYISSIIETKFDGVSLPKARQPSSMRIAAWYFSSRLNAALSTTSSRATSELCLRSARFGHQGADHRSALLLRPDFTMTSSPMQLQYRPVRINLHLIFPVFILYSRAVHLHCTQKEKIELWRRKP